jgi:hypothetical protein
LSKPEFARFLLSVTPTGNTLRAGLNQRTDAEECFLMPLARASAGYTPEILWAVLEALATLSSLARLELEYDLMRLIAQFNRTDGGGPRR